MSKKILKLKQNYDNICNEFVKIFADKHDIEFDGWVADEVGTIASFCFQYFFNMDDIIYDITTNQPKHLILDWQNDSTNYNMDKEYPNTTYINFRSYSKGARYEMLNKTETK